MRFIKLLTVVALVAAVTTSAAPATDKREIMELDQPLDKKAFIFDPKKMRRETARRKKLHQRRSDDCCNGKHQHKKKRSEMKECCGKIGLGLGGRLDISAGTEAPPAPAAPVVAPVPPPAPAPVPAAAEAPAAPINRNDRNGDSVVVVVDAKHN